ncbi:MAG TPA: class I SAM-dependent methyltransferase [Thermoanaerobaculia bacterium]|nr:class I SAM-dependent methyltransferase [Thermoanaerobaculia bacterium]
MISQKNGAYDAWHRMQAEKEDALGGAGDHLWHQMVRRRLGSISQLRVAEVGCGRGDFAIFLAREGAEVVALDASREALELGKERARERGVDVQFILGNAEETGLASSAFDLVISCECLEHVDSPRRMATELHRICKPGGRCIITTPSYLNAELLSWAVALLRRKQYSHQPRDNFFLFFRVKRMLQKAGFSVIDTDSRYFRFLLLPRVDPDRLRVLEFESSMLNRLFRPFGLHFLFDLEKPRIGQPPM